MEPKMNKIKPSYEAEFDILMRQMSKSETMVVEHLLQWFADNAEFTPTQTLILYAFKRFDIWAKETRA